MAIDFTLVDRAEQLPELAQRLLVAEAYGFDSETTAFRPWLGEIRLLQFNIDEGIWVVDLFKTKGPGPLVDAMAKTNAVCVWQNGKFDQKWLLHKYGLEIGRNFDTFRASAMVHNGAIGMKHDLYAILARELAESQPTQDLGGSDWSGTLTSEQYEYAAGDVLFLLRLRSVLKSQLAKLSLNTIARIEFGAILPEAALELKGFYLDKSAWMALADRHAGETQELRRQLMRELPSPSNQMALPGFDVSWNLDSPKQVLESFRKLGIDVENTNHMTLAMLAGRHKILQRFLRYREVSKRVTAFGPEYMVHIDVVTGRVHSDYYPMKLTGRYGSSHPNLQQIPREKAFRECFRAEKGRILVGADYCVAAGTKVATMRGLVPVEQVRNQDVVVLEDGSTAPVTAVVDSGILPVVRVRTRMGYELVATALHRIRVMDAGGNYEWRRIGELRVTDAVAIQGGRGCACASGAVGLPAIEFTHPNNSWEVAAPAVLTAEAAEILGYLTGDGSFGHKGPRFVVCYRDPEVFDYLAGQMRRLFNLVPSRSEYRGVIEGRLFSVPLGRWLHEVGASKSEVPWVLWEASAEVVAAYLRGLFEADGSVGDRVSFSTISETLAREVQQLLLALGILSARRIQRHGKGVGFVWVVSVPAAFTAKFGAAVGFLSARKKARLGGLVVRTGKSPTHGRIPNLTGRAKSLHLSGEPRILLNNTISSGRDVSVGVAKQLDERFPEISEQLGLHRTVRFGTYFDRVGVIEEVGEDHVFDLSVPGPETYVSGGFVSHNSQIELRVVAEISGDPVLVETYRTGGDVHRKTAAYLLKVDESQVTKDHRQLAKAINFGLVFGMGAEKLVIYAQSEYHVSMTEKQAAKFRSGYFELYAGVARWHERALTEGKRARSARSIGGRIRFLEGEEYHTEFLNHPVQSTNADGLKASLPLVYRRLKQYGGRASLVHMVHDELIAECDNDPELVEAVKKDLQEGMIAGASPFFKRVPVMADPAAGESWAACKG